MTDIEGMHAPTFRCTASVVTVSTFYYVASVLERKWIFIA